MLVAVQEVAFFLLSKVEEVKMTGRDAQPSNDGPEPVIAKVVLYVQKIGYHIFFIFLSRSVNYTYRSAYYTPNNEPRRPIYIKQTTEDNKQ